MKRTILFFLALVIIFTVFACARKKADQPAVSTTVDTTSPITTSPVTTTPFTTVVDTTVSETETQISTTEPAVTTTVDPLKPVVPEIDFEGKEFIIATKEGTLRVEVYSDETSSEPLPVSIMMRNSAVEDEYNVIIVPLISYDGSLYGQVNEIVDMVLSDEDIIDITLTYAAASGALAMQRVLQDWNSLEYNDFSKEYWISGANDRLIMDGALYSAVGDMCTTALTNAYAVYYNRDKGDTILDDNGKTLTETVFDKIDTNEWTIDYFMSIVSDVYDDIDDVSGRSENDFYGFTADKLTNLDVYTAAFDIPMLVGGTDTVLKNVFRTEKTADAFDKINTLYWNTEGSYCEDNIPNARFLSGNALFCTTWLGQSYNGSLWNMTERYEILPYPKLDSTQDKYRTGFIDNYSVISIPVTCSELDMVSIITEALNYETMVGVHPVFYEKVLHGEGDHDAKSIEMLDIIMDGRTFDLATLWMNDLAISFRNAVTDKSGDFFESYDMRSDAYDLKLKALIEIYTYSAAP